MLQELAIRNFAIIDDMRIGFGDGLTVLSGETGAGKSIIVSAVNLLLGSRASARTIREGAESAEIEALFRIKPGSRRALLLEENGCEPGEELLIRRIISSGDRNRIYINGRLSTIQMLESVSENLASISGQHAHQGLLKEENHLLVLDRFGGLIPFRERVHGCFHRMLPVMECLEALKKVASGQSQRRELLEVQRREISSAAPAPGEDAALEGERNRLKNAETLYQAVHRCHEGLYSGQGSALERLSEAVKDLAKAATVDPVLKESAESLAETVYQVEDVALRLRDYLAALQMDERRVEWVEARLDVLNRLKRKYSGSLDGVLAHLESIEEELAGTVNLEEKISDAEKQLAILREELIEAARDLSARRKKAAGILSGRIEKELASLKMAGARFEVSFPPRTADDRTSPHFRLENSAVGPAGVDRAVFGIAPNPGEGLKELAAIASGGELSRVVLALKAILAETDSVETIVFDEVDAGVGGGTAEVVGRKLAGLARHHQVICITHLPQIARFGDHHFRISKEVRHGRTRTVIAPVRGEDRVREMARMLGGVRITETTLRHAREMLEGTVDGGR